LLLLIESKCLHSILLSMIPSANKLLQLLYYRSEQNVVAQLHPQQKRIFAMKH